MIRFVAFAVLLAAGSIALAQRVESPGAGSPLRKAILDAWRVPVQKSLKGRPVLFKVTTLRVSGDWAFVSGKAIQPNGRPMDYRGTVYQEAIDAGVFDDWVCGLLKRTNGKWSVKAWALGATDVPWDGWDKRFGAPRAIFPYGN